MAKIPRRYVDDFTKAINKLSDDVRERLGNALLQIDMTDVTAARAAIVDVMELHLGPYTDMAAVLAAEFYDGIREFSVDERLGASVESGRDPRATEKAVRGIVQDAVEGKDVEEVVRKLTERADYEIKKAAGECVRRNVKRDPLKPKYARVPTGTETCKFCIMLASRGFVYHSEKTAGGDGHYHSNCDCRIIPGFGKNPSVEGYDPDEYLHLYNGMDACRVRDSKCSAYLLDPEHESGKHKAILFEKYLGFKQEDASELKRQLYIAGGKNDFTLRGTDIHGERYSQSVIMVGKDGRKAIVEIGWIKRPGSDKMDLVTAIPRREIK